MSTSTAFPSAAGLAILFAVSLLTIFTTALGLYMVLVQIELQSTLSFAEDADEVELEENSASTNDDASNNSNKEDAKSSKSTNDSHENEDGPSGGDGVARRMHLPMIRRGALAAIVSVIAFMTYLLLAVSNAPVLLSWVGELLLLFLLLRQTIFEEIRRERFDRLASIFTLVLVLAMSINLAVYANRQHAQGDIYEGKARIIGYDYSSYSQEKDDAILRTDLEVAWGGWWGCPRTQQQCEAFVSGALCETKEEEDEVYVYNDGGYRKQRRLQLPGKMPQSSSSRHLADDQNNNGDAADQQNNGNSGDQNQQNNGSAGDQNQQNNNNNDAGGDDQDLEEQNAELQQENEALQEQNEELEAANEELQEELDEYEQYAEDEEEEIDEIYEDYYSFDDDFYEDEYWGGTSWDDVWGEYACEDLFAYDVEGETYDENDPPGSDEWPFVKIYGNCNTCEAYIVDFYSTEHFQEILSYKQAGLWYGILAGLSSIATWFLIFKQKNSTKKSADKEIELLPTSEGALA